jgi:hypothetical protein
VIGHRFRPPTPNYPASTDIYLKQEKPPPVTSAKSTKFENLKRYQQQVFQNRRGPTSSTTASSNPAYSSSKPVYTSPDAVYSGSGPAYPGQIVTKNSLYARQPTFGCQCYQTLIVSVPCKFFHASVIFTSKAYPTPVKYFTVPQCMSRLVA